MPDFNLYRNPNLNNALDGRYPAGNAPADPSGPLDVNLNNGILSVTTDGTYDFGAVGPVFGVLADAYGLPVGQSTKADLTLGAGVTVQGATTDNFLAVSDVGRMGRGFEVGCNDDANVNQNGTSTNRFRANFDQNYSKVFVSRSYYWPLAHQTAAEPYLNGSCTWQYKPTWFAADEEFSSADTNFFIEANTLWLSGSNRFDINVAQKSNSVGTNTFPRVNNIDRGDSFRRPYDEVYFLDALYDQGSADGVTADGSVQIYHRTDSRVLNNTELTGLNLAEVNGPTKLINSANFVGFIRGFNRPNNFHMYNNDLYIATGEGAACRVAISDNADYFASNRCCLLETTSWGSGAITANVRDGIFAGNYSGLYVNLIGADNQQIASKQL